MTKAFKDTLFKVWVLACGHNLKQIAAAGEYIGLPKRRSLNVSRGEVELTMAELLAMSAHRAGLKPWSPEYDAELDVIRQRICGEQPKQKTPATGTETPER
jgi:hypothetical protein